MAANILHIINGEHYSGAERVQDLLANKLSVFGYNVYIGCIKPKNFLTYCQVDKEKIYSFPMHSKLDISIIFKIRTFIMEKNVAIIHTHTPRSILIGIIVSILTGIPLVHHLHSPTDKDTEKKRLNAINSIVEQICLLKTRHIFTVSHSLKTYLTDKKINRNKISVIQNGVPILSPAMHSKQLKTDSDNQFRIGTIALFRPRKGLEVLMRALSHLKSKYQNIKLIVVGEFVTTDYERKIKKYSSELGIDHMINWRGFSEDVNTELEKMDLFVLPSLFGEGTPMVILEAMAAKTPIISTTVEGIPEIIRHKKDGLLSEPGNALSLYQMIAKIIDGNINTSALVDSAYKRQIKYFSDLCMAEGVAKIYSDIIKT